MALVPIVGEGNSFDGLDGWSKTRKWLIKVYRNCQVDPNDMDNGNDMTPFRLDTI